MLAEGLGLSGIVSILFTGIVSAYDIFPGLFHVCIKTLWWLFWCFVLGYEALCIFKFVTKFSKICLCFFWVDIIISRNVYVRMISFTVFSRVQTLPLNDVWTPFVSYRFIYMGFDIAMEQHSWSHVGFIFFSVVSFLLLP